MLISNVPHIISSMFILVSISILKKRRLIVIALIHLGPQGPYLEKGSIGSRMQKNSLNDN